MTTVDFNVWTLTVDSLCLEKLACTWNDLSGEQQPLSDAGLSPQDFVDWWAHKYDLTFTDEWSRPLGKTGLNEGTEGM